jgi:general secretion pathway protein H
MARMVLLAVRVKTLMWGTGNKAFSTACSGMKTAGTSAFCEQERRQAGFTIVELLVAITIIGLVLAVAVPSSMRSYQSMQYRSAVTDVISILTSARHAAVNQGTAQDVKINTVTGELRLGTTVKFLPSDINVVVHSVGELNEGNVGVIRFYPEGGSSGGGVDLELPTRSAVRINVDWLMGRVSQEKYAIN